MTSTALCDAQLRRAYRRYNALYFKGSLPDDADILFAPTECYGVTQQDDGGFVITIDPKYAIESRMWRLTLLHEMVHLDIWPKMSHGAAFQGEMFRLAQAGAFAKLW